MTYDRCKSDEIYGQARESGGGAVLAGIPYLETIPLAIKCG